MESRLKSALVGIAANPATPSDLLLRLVAVPEAVIRIAWNRADIGAPVAEALLATDHPRVALALATAHRSESAIRELVANHPKVEVREARRRYVESSSAPLYLDDLVEYAGPGGLVELAAHPNPRLRESVACSWLAMPDTVRRALLADPEPRVRVAAAGLPQPPAPTDLHAELLADAATRTVVAGYAVLTTNTARELANGDDDLRSAIAGNPTLPAQTRDRLAEDPNAFVRAEIIKRQDLPEGRRRQLYRELAAETKPGHDDSWLALEMLKLAKIDWLTTLPLDERLTYLDSPIPSFRVALARCRDLPPHAAAQLDSDVDASVRSVVAFRPDVPAAVLERLIMELGDTKFRTGLTRHPNFPKAAFRRLASHREPGHRVLALDDADLPGDLVAELATDSNAAVRSAAAGHPRIPVERLVALLDDDDPGVREQAGMNPNLPRQAMVDLLDRTGL